MPDGHQKRVGKGCLNGIVKFGQDRINIHKNHQVKDSKGQKDHMQRFVHGAFHLIDDPDVHKQQQGSYQHDQVNNGSLLEIFLEGFEKASYNIGFFVAHHLQGDIEHCCDGSPGRDDGDTADNAEKVENDQIRNPAHKYEEFVVHVKNTIHSVTSFLSKICR